MKLSEMKIEDLKIKEPANSIYSDEEITHVVYDGIIDNGNNNDWCIVFGNSNQIKERTETVIEKYFEGRFKKIILCGGTKGISNINGECDSEAIRMKRIIVKRGIPEEVIHIDDKSQNTFENIDNAFNIIKSFDSDIKNVSIISGEYHLKRCMLALIKNYPTIEVTTIPSYTGYTDKNNWFNGNNEWNTGRCTIIWERNLLSKYAKERKIYDSEILYIKNKVDIRTKEL